MKKEERIHDEHSTIANNFSKPEESIEYRRSHLYKEESLAEQLVRLIKTSTLAKNNGKQKNRQDK